MKKVLTLITVAGGEPTMTKKNDKAVQAKCGALGGTCIEIGDKFVDLEFPSDAAAQEFKTFAQARGAFFQ